MNTAKIKADYMVTGIEMNKKPKKTEEVYYLFSMTLYQNFLATAQCKKKDWMTFVTIEDTILLIWIHNKIDFFLFRVV